MTQAVPKFLAGAKNVLLAELYTDFVPRWLKRPDTTFAPLPARTWVAWIAPTLKLAAGTGAIALMADYDLGKYEPVIGAAGLYAAADAVYQLLDLGHPYSEGLRKAATIAVDLISLPFYLGSRARHTYVAR